MNRYTINQPSPLVCETTKQVVNLKNIRFSRADLNRLLTSYGVEHHAGGSLEHLLQLAQMNNIPLEPLPPGPVKRRRLPQWVANGEPEPPHTPQKKRAAHQIKYAKDGFPQQVPVIRGMLKDRGIETKPTLKRVQGVKLLREYQEQLGRE